MEILMIVLVVVSLVLLIVVSLYSLRAIIRWIIK